MICLSAEPKHESGSLGFSGWAGMAPPPWNGIGMLGITFYPCIIGLMVGDYAISIVLTILGWALHAPMYKPFPI